MTILSILMMIGGLLIFLSQSSYAYVIAKVDFSVSERRVHCIHHGVHAVCGLLLILIGAAFLRGDMQNMIHIVCCTATIMLILDALSFVILDKVMHFAIRRDAIMHKWKGEKVFGPEHDREVSVYRTLTEITQKNLLRDGIHLMLFVILFVVSL